MRETPQGLKARGGLGSQPMVVHDSDVVFADSVPELYDRYLVPLIFESYATDLVARLNEIGPGAILEVAAGTGAVTRAMAECLPEPVSSALKSRSSRSGYPVNQGWLISRRASDPLCLSVSCPSRNCLYRNRAFDVDHVSHFDDVRATVVDHHDGPSGPAGASHR